MNQLSVKHISIRIERRLDRWLRIEAAKLDVSKSEFVRSILSETANLPEDVDVHDYSWRRTADNSIRQGDLSNDSAK